jgi:hypothetical protein
MKQSELDAANRASALEQLAQDERNELAKANMKADELMRGPAHTPHYFPENPKEDFLREIVEENIKQSRCQK